MRILILTLNLIQQGSYWRGYHLGRQLAARGHAVTLVATSRRNRLHFSTTLEANLELVQSPDLWTGMLRSGYDPWNTIRRMVWLQGRKYDVVHAIEARPTVVYPARLVARKSQAPLIFDWADWFGKGGSIEERSNAVLRNLLRPVETYFEEHFRPKADGNTVINPTLYQRAIKLGIDPGRLFLLPNGSDTQRIYPISKTAARIQSGLPPDQKIIGYIGTIFPRDAALMAEAFDLLQIAVPGTRLLVIGRCPVNIREFVNHPELVEMTGILDDNEFVRRLACCDLFWLPLTDSPANRGRTPLKYTDYLAAGRPVIATAVGELKQIFKDGEAGLLTPCAPRSFSDATARLLQNPEQMIAMGISARQLAESTFDWGALSDRLLNFYQKIRIEKANGR